MSTNDLRSEFYRVLSGHKGQAVHKFFESLAAAQRLDFLQLREASPEHSTWEAASKAATELDRLATRIWVNKGPNSFWVSEYIKIRTESLRMHRLSDFWFTLRELESESESDGNGNTKP